MKKQPTKKKAERNEMNDYPKNRHSNCLDRDCRICLEDATELGRYVVSRNPSLAKDCGTEVTFNWMNNHGLPAEGAGGWASDDTFKPENIEGMIARPHEVLPAIQLKRDLAKIDKRTTEMARENARLRKALSDLIPTPFPAETLEDCECVECLIVVGQLREARRALTPLP